MDQYNFFKGLNSEIDNEIIKIQQPKKKVTKSQDSKKVQTKLPLKKQNKSIWDASFFEPPELHSEQQTKSLATRGNQLNITHMKKQELFEIMKNVMTQFLESKKLSILRLQNIIENIDIQKITKKTIKDKIILFSKLLSIPMIHEKKKIRFQNEIKIPIQPHYNLKENNIMKNIFAKNKLLNFGFQNTNNMMEYEYFLYCILKSIKIYYPDFIPSRYKCLTFSNINNLVQPKSFQDVVKFLHENFSSIFFIIQEIGMQCTTGKRFYSRIFFINDPTLNSNTKTTYLDVLRNNKSPKIFLQKIVSANPSSIKFKIVSSAKEDVVLDVHKNEEFCSKK